MEKVYNMNEEEIIVNEQQVRKYMLQVHNRKDVRGLDENHVLAYFHGQTSPIIDFINSWEINANIFKNQILKYLHKCKNKEQIDYVKQKSNEAYDMLSIEHRNIAILSRNVPNNPLITITSGAEIGDNKNKELVENIKKGLMPKKEE